jgi:sterol desaturase/sphingolipid hydroxylase (fatty acid hydroxylase superfamily)
MHEISIGLGLGIAVWLIGLIVPFRRFATRPEIGWDVLGAAGATAFAYLAEMPLDALTEWVERVLAAWGEIIDTAPSWARILGYLLVADFGAYWAHRALHSRWLWAAHAWHHSSKYLYWVSGLRGSPVHIVVLLVPYWIAFVLFPVAEAAIAGAALLVLEIGNQHLIHSNIKVPAARWVESVFVTPRFHFVHHNKRREIANSNYGFVFSIWDRLFGTYTDPGTVAADAALGIEHDVARWRLLLGLPAPRSADPTKVPPR